MTANDLDHNQANQFSTQQWWDTAHQTNSLLLLSGYPGPDIWKRLEIEDRIVPGATVLNIGVGMGYCTRALHEKGCVVHALDISPDALAKVSDIATTWLSADLDRLPADTFDLAISHLVAQHMLDDALSAQLQGIIRSLKPVGIFAMQFLTRPISDQTAFTDDDAKGGGVSRTTRLMTDLVSKAGGEIVYLVDKDQGDLGERGGKWLWKIAHVRRA